MCVRSEVSGFGELGRAAGVGGQGRGTLGGNWGKRENDVVTRKGNMHALASLNLGKGTTRKELETCTVPFLDCLS